MLSLLTLADHPGDTTARFHVAHSPLAEHVGLTDHADSPAAGRLAETTRRRLMVEGYAWRWKVGRGNRPLFATAAT